MGAVARSVMNGSIHGDLPQPVSVEETLEIYGTAWYGLHVTGSGVARVFGLVVGLVVVEDGWLDVHGSVLGDLLVLDGEVVVYGRVTGSVTVEGGRLDLWGRVTGDLVVEGGDVRLVEGAVHGTVRGGGTASATLPRHVEVPQAD